MEGVTATDKEDGDLTDDITVTGEVDENEVGEYELKYTVKDSKGLKDEVTRTVTVSDSATINAKNVTILKGEEFDPLAGVTATDPKDGDITDDIEVIGADEVDTDTIGEYKVTYKVTNNRGITTEIEITVTVDVTPPEIVVQTHTQVKVGNDAEEYDLMEGVTAKDYDGDDITSDIEI